ncbi:MAG: tRNA pseudouridine(38-40) synthase TruA [Oscillospiraceae bacterium]|nr:tRNA pseudouridine(38-40) synthase TruA [Oscillospiraceae bacterium]
MMRNFKLTLAYDGTRYRGWQRQGNTADTVQGKLETLLARLLGRNVEVHGSGRTDAGVHARGQVASFRADTGLSCDELLSALRQYLPADIGALELTEAPERFHARLSAKEKTYLYRVWNSDAPCVFERKYVYVFPRPLDLEAMRSAAAALCGRHDFAAFSTGKKQGRASTRTLRSVTVERLDGEVRLTYTADGFLYNMARIMTGTLLEIGAGDRPAEDIGRIFASMDRTQAGFTAPPQGLCLLNVRYE